MKQTLSRTKINYILTQMFIFTFVCIMTFIDIYLNEDLVILKFGIQSFTIIVFVIYEIVINISFNKIRNNENNKKNQSTFQEQFLWFEILLLLDIIFISAVISRFFNKPNITLFLIIALLIYYLMSILIRPYFGINPKKNNS